MKITTSALPFSEEFSLSFDHWDES